MKTPTPTEVKMSALDEHRFASGQPDSQAFPDFHATKPSRVTRKQKTRLETPAWSHCPGNARTDCVCNHLAGIALRGAAMTPYLLYAHIDGIDIAEYHPDCAKLIVCNETGYHGIRIGHLGLVELGVELIHLGKRLQEAAEGGAI